MSKAPKKLPPIVGRWRITEMGAWDSDWSDADRKSKNGQLIDDYGYWFVNSR
jgi:hypothetical protein